jgi:PAS domain S-box-containing protein
MNYLKQELYDLVRNDPAIFDFIQESSLDGVWYFDVENGEDVWMSPKCWRTLGYGPEEWPHKTSSWRSIIFEEDLKVADENFMNHCKDDKYPYDQVVRYRHRDGSTVWIRCRGILIRDAHGKPVRMLGAHIDVTKEHKAVEELRTQNRRYFDILAGTNVGTWEWNVQTGEVQFNERWSEILGYTLDELQPISISTWQKFAHPQDLQRSNDLLKDHFAGNSEYYECEARMKHRNGEWVWVLDKGKVAQWTSDGKPLLMTGSHIDITEIKKTQTELSLSEQRFRSAFEYSAIGMAFVSLEGRFYKVNKQLCSMLGYSPEELQSKTFQDITHPDDLAIDLRQAGELLAGKINNYKLEKRYFHKDGSVVWILLSGTLVRDLDGEPLHFVAQVEDITDRKKFEADLRHTNEELESFSYTVAHDLRGPLRNISALAGFLTIKPGESLVDDDIRILDGIVKSVKHMAQLVDDLLNLSRLGRTEVQRQFINTATLIESVLDNHLNDAERARVEVTFGDLEPLNCDPNLMSHVFTNLISNAIKYSRKKEKPLVEIGSHKDGKEVTYFVRDNGAGFDMKYAQKLFMAFERLHASSEFEGTGVGLAIVHRVILKHGGKVWAEAVPGKGATFYFSLPV